MHVLMPPGARRRSGPVGCIVVADDLVAVNRTCVTSLPYSRCSLSCSGAGVASAEINPGGYLNCLTSGTVQIVTDALKIKTRRNAMPTSVPGPKR